MNVSSVVVVGISLFLVLAQEDIGFTGVWERNADQSDDSQQKMQEAMTQVRRGRGRRAPGGGGGPGRGRTGGGDGGARPDWGKVSNEVTVELADGELHVDDGERMRIYYLDGETHERQTPTGTKLETVAEHKGNAVFIEEKMERGRVDRKFELSPDGATMIMTVTVELERMTEPVVMRTVYQRAGEAG